MSIQYKQIEIDDVVKTAFENFKTTEFDNSCIGTCGLGQAATYYAALKHGVPKDCIKMCQANDILQGCRHAFAIIILNEIYLVDLTFKQYLCLWEQDKQSNLMRKHFPVEKMERFFEKGYERITEDFLMVYYRFIRRDCFNNSDQTPFDEIQLFPAEEKYIRQGSFNLVEMTVCHNWSNNNVDYSKEEIEGLDWNKTGSWF